MNTSHNGMADSLRRLMRWLVLLSLGPVLAVQAAETMSDCVKIVDDSERLACYDRSASSNVPQPPAPTAPPTTHKSTAPQPASAPAVVPEPTPAPATAPEPPSAQVPVKPADAAPAPPVGESQDDFGFGGRRTEAIDEIRSRFVGPFTGWSGRSLFRLENGQVWKQSQSGRFVHRRDSPMITIKRAAFGSYRLYVEGLNRSVSVKRIE